MLKADDCPTLQNALTEGYTAVRATGLESNQLTIIQPGQANLSPIESNRFDNRTRVGKTNPRGEPQGQRLGIMTSRFSLHRDSACRPKARMAVRAKKFIRTSSLMSGYASRYRTTPETPLESQ